LHNKNQWTLTLDQIEVAEGEEEGNRTKEVYHKLCLIFLPVVMGKAQFKTSFILRHGPDTLSNEEMLTITSISDIAFIILCLLNYWDSWKQLAADTASNNKRDKKDASKIFGRWTQALRNKGWTAEGRKAWKTIQKQVETFLKDDANRDFATEFLTEIRMTEQSKKKPKPNKTETVIVDDDDDDIDTSFWV
jgi:hypothetical protein